MDEVTGGWRKLRDEELHNLYFSPNIIRMIKSKEEIEWACSPHGSKEKYIQNFGSKPKVQLGRPICRWETKIKNKINSVGDVDWINPNTDKKNLRDFVNTVVNLQAISNVENIFNI
jgi:hypothetical protein